MRRVVAAPLVATAAGLLSVGGCGGSGGPSKSEYIAKADAICRSAQTQAAPLIQKLTFTVTGSPAPARMRRAAAIVGDLQAIGRSYMSRLRALERPGHDDKAIAAFLVPTGQVIDALAEARAALQRGETVRALGLLQQAQPVDAEAGAAARSYGFKQCGSIISGSA